MTEADHGKGTANGAAPAPAPKDFIRAIVEEAHRLVGSDFTGLILQDEPARSAYPMPVLAWEKDDVFVGRIRRDHTVASGLNLWIVSDNLRKGAATNAVQIAEEWIRGERP